MTGTDLYVNKCKRSRSYLNHLVYKSVLWRVAKCLSYIEDARCLKVKRVYLQHCTNTNKLVGP